ncbi:Virulence factor MVIN-like protein, partial [Pseudomonas syringae pv. aceris]
LLTGLAVSVVLLLSAGGLVRLIGPGLDADGYAQAASGLRWLAWCAPGFMLHALFCVPLQARSRFVLAGLGSLLFNLPPVIYLATFSHASTSTGLASACVLGSVLMPGVLLPARSV